MDTGSEALETCHERNIIMRTMEFRLTRKWVKELRRDVKAWDLQVETGRASQEWERWNWPDITPPLTYMSPEATSVPMRRARRASTGMNMRTGRQPPSVAYSGECERFVTMQMRLPVHIWAMLSHGREAESAMELSVISGITAKGIACRQRWREYDGEGYWESRDDEGEPDAQQWTELYVRRLDWFMGNGVWHPSGWRWEVYDRYGERADAIRRRLHASSAPWETVPQEVLLVVIRILADTWDTRTLAAATQVCRAWLPICSPRLFDTIFVRPLRCKELLEDLLKPSSRIAQYTDTLWMRGAIPWQALPRMLALLPRLNNLCINMDGQWAEGSYVLNSPTSSMYHHGAPRLTIIHAMSRTMPPISRLHFGSQHFHSSADLLGLLSSFPHISSAELSGCSIQAASTLTPRVRSTRLAKLVFERRSSGTIVPDKAMSSLAQWWRWPQAAKSTSGLYPGLHWVDAQMADEVISAVLAVSFDWIGVHLSRDSEELSPIASRTVLIAKINSDAITPGNIELEFHTAHDRPQHLRPHSEGNNSPRARVRQIVIRFDANRASPKRDDSETSLAVDMLGSIDARLTTAPLPELQTITLETLNTAEHLDLPEKMPRLHARAMVRLRTCKEAQEVAQEVKKCCEGHWDEDIQGVVSPLWASDKYDEYDRKPWLELVAQRSRQGKDV